MIYGWDVSTSLIGLSKFDDSGVYLGSWYCDLRKIDSDIDKALKFRDWLFSHDINTSTSNSHFIEDKLGNFSSGKTMIQTLMKLASFHAVCCFLIVTHREDIATDVTLKKLHPSTWKAIMKKEGLVIPKGSKEKKKITLEYIKTRFSDKFPYEGNRNDNPKPWCYDMADSACIGIAGIKQKCIKNVSSMR